MVYAAVNHASMTKTAEQAARTGLQFVQTKPLHPSYQLFRFASYGYRVDWLTNPWWTGFSSADALQKLSDFTKERLSQLARAALAVYITPGKEYNRMDVLLSVQIVQPLEAYMGTPRTIRTKDEKGRYLERWEPDRSMAQFYVPGLEFAPRALALLEARQIPGNRWNPTGPLP